MINRSRVIIATRVCLLISVGLVLSLPWWWFLLSLMIPVFASLTPCGDACSDSSNTMQVVIAGYVDNACTRCDELNATWGVTKSSSCDYTTSTFVDVCTFGGSAANIDVSLTKVAGVVRATGGIRYPLFTVATYRNDDVGIGAAPANCRSISSVDLPYISDSWGVYCSGVATSTFVISST